MIFTCIMNQLALVMRKMMHMVFVELNPIIWGIMLNVKLSQICSQKLIGTQFHA